MTLSQPSSHRHPSPQQLPLTLRQRVDELKRQGGRMNLVQAVAIVVPVCTQVADLHESGARLFVYPACIVEGGPGHYQLQPELAQLPPRGPADIACIPQELRAGGAGDARASVYSIAAMLYELVTGELVKPGMKRPTDVVPGLPPELEFLLSRALVVEMSQRPHDLRALAAAIHKLAPHASLPPPPANPASFGRESIIPVDVSFSMLPPAALDAEAFKLGALQNIPNVPNLPNLAGAPASQRNPGARPLGVAPAASRPLGAGPVSRPLGSSPLASGPQSAPNSTAALTALKAQLEADPSPRYVAVKDGMDHGPFTAVELLQQIASHGFAEDDQIRDNRSGEQRPVRDWPQFAPFGDHARRHRDDRNEKAAIERVVAHESRSTRSKALLGIGIVAFLLLGAGGWYVKTQGARNDEVAVQQDTSTSIEADGEMTGKKRGGQPGSGNRIVGKSGKFPLLAGGMSCEAASKDYTYEMSMGNNGPADLTSGQYAGVLNSGSYFSHCGVPDSMSVSICAAVQNGRAVGVTVTTKPGNGRVQGCISESVRRLNFPSHPRLDVTRTTFAAQ